MMMDASAVVIAANDAAAGSMGDTWTAIQLVIGMIAIGSLFGLVIGYLTGLRWLVLVSWFGALYAGASVAYQVFF